MTPWLSGRPPADDSEQKELRELLGAVRRRWFAVTFCATAGRAAAAASAPLLIAAAAGRIAAPSGGLLLAMATAALGLAGAAALAVFARMRRRPDDGQVARFVEEQCAEGNGSLADALVSAVQVTETPQQHPPAFAVLIVRRAVQALRAVAPEAVISSEAMRRAMLEAAVGVAVFAAAAVLAFPIVLRAGATAWVRLFPHTIGIAVHSGSGRVPAGEPFRIEASLRGRGVALLGVVPTLVVSADGQQRAVPMAPAGGAFSYSIQSVDRSFEYRVTAGAAVSSAYTVTALFAPRVTRIDLHYEYPAFTGQRPRVDEDGGDIYGPAGTRVRLRIHTDRPVKAGELALSEGRPVPVTHAGERCVTADLVLAKDNAYRVRLTDTDGLHSAGDLEYFIRVMDDRPPDIRIVRPAADQGITPLEEVAIEARAEDDHGVAGLELVYAVAGRRPRSVPFSRVAGSDLVKVGTYLLAAEDLDVQPGDVVTYYAKVRDVARGKRPTETRSDMFFLEVKPFNEEFVAAQSQAMGGAAGTPIDGLIAAQKEIINATWSLERRSGAGRSESDTKAVGQAQAELKTRIEQMLRGGRRATPGLFPQQVRPSPQPALPRPGNDPVGVAIQAMGRAVDALDRARTADAIPHEMEALQGLLQAQAEVRRRQVMQQSASGAGQGGTSRTDRDLSALFDRELQRQQRTNYETSASSGTPPREENTDAVDRIRDLARRQEELVRRQRELAQSRLSPEEKKRQLDRLTREQEELRQRAERLEKELQGAATARAPNGGDASGSGQRHGDLRRATEEMREAGREMQRQDAGRAAARAQRAAEALLDSERRMRGGSTNARQRAAGDLQLEAQQIADAQRRLAGELARAEKDGSTNADAWRRLASEKDKLADRVESLQRHARELDRDTPGAAGMPFREAGQQLQKERIADRMRSGANGMRQRAEAPGKPSAPTAQNEAQLSRALDSVVDRLGGAGEGRRLTEELDRTRQMRERLNALEGRMREAERNARNGRQMPEPPAPERGRGGSGRASGGSADQELQRAREEYARELQQARDALARTQSAEGRDGGAGATPEHHEYSRSAPGDEAFKQDFSGWEKLRREIDVRMERYESEVAARLARKSAEDRLSAGGSERIPEAYRESVSRYFESLAKGKR